MVVNSTKGSVTPRSGKHTSFGQVKSKKGFGQVCVRITDIILCSNFQEYILLLVCSEMTIVKFMLYYIRPRNFYAILLQICTIFCKIQALQTGQDRPAGTFVSRYAGKWSNPRLQPTNPQI
jgi:hypothetical protein